MNFTAELPDISLLDQPAVFLVGIKGVGMTALALMLQEAGVVVSGADVEEVFVTDSLLQAAGIPVVSLTEGQVPDEATVVVYSGAHRGWQNPLVQQALQAEKQVVHLAGAVGLLSREQKTVGVCGVGGKSTTSALLSWILSQNNAPLSYAVGVGSIPNLGKSGHWDSAAEYFVVEADEYVADPIADKTPRFLFLEPHILICTSLSYDHPDVYEDFSDTQKAFRLLFEKLPADGLLVYNGDNADLRDLIATAKIQAPTVSVGEQPENDVQLSDWQVEDGIGSVLLGARKLETRVPGRHNLLNAAYAAVVAEHVGREWSEIVQAVREFSSTQRRFESKGTTVAGALCYDDYAHHPREIQAIVRGLKEWFPEKRITIAFQPHTFSRTKALRNEFVDALAGGADEVVLAPIFASAREAFDPSITSDDIVHDLQARGQQARLLSPDDEMLQCIQALGPDDVFITLGAGDIYKVYDHVELH
ncbi:Mur ligase domain-containing protein [Candidatus Woesebacteria bacterium]|nr:Mur ligase domain-containing protein [Candidatus Woesebacteria bacterium]MCD8506905.1 Mur ligase domain-containing protein [Candidatus Woesebacteria bacterium]MCD8527476.1 Mur ligase domain-containing protein [Candidatus Woesebacteria bacterium]MCD8546218.1 Mur ligase domain-containing protein [Candidatus Woesebacteria bacterium]